MFMRIQQCILRDHRYECILYILASVMLLGQD